MEFSLFGVTFDKTRLGADQYRRSALLPCPLHGCAGQPRGNALNPTETLARSRRLGRNVRKRLVVPLRASKHMGAEVPAGGRAGDLAGGEARVRIVDLHDGSVGPI